MHNDANVKGRIAAVVFAHTGQGIEAAFLLAAVASIVAIVALESAYPGANAGRPGIRTSAGAPIPQPYVTPTLTDIPLGIRPGRPWLGRHVCDCGFENSWWGRLPNNDYVWVLAGVNTLVPNDGLILVSTMSPNLAWQSGEYRYETPILAGSFHIVSYDGLQLTLLSSNGTRFVFDVGTRNWIVPPVTPTLSVPLTSVPTATRRATHALTPTVPAWLATSQAIATVTAQAQAANRHLGISDLAFIDPLHGWYLAAYCPDGDSNNCDRPFNATTDGGQTWPVLGTSPRTAGRILFANAQDGWVYDPDLYSTHDGGKTWVQDTEVAGAPPVSGESIEITSLQLLGGTLAALVDRCYLDPTQRVASCTDTLRLSTDNGRSWQSSGGFVPKKGLVVRLGKVATQNIPLGWLLVEDFHSSTPDSVHLSISHDDGHTWQARPELPCYAEDSTMLAGDGASSIWLLCADQPGAGSQAKSLYVSADEGRNWELRSSDGQHGEIPRVGYAHSLTVTSPQNAWLALDRGTLYETNDAGRTWTAALPMPGDGSNIGEVLFVDAQHGWWPTFAALYRTTDGGAHWIPTSP